LKFAARPPHSGEADLRRPGRTRENPGRRQRRSARQPLLLAAPEGAVSRSRPPRPRSARSRVAAWPKPTRTTGGQPPTVGTRLEPGQRPEVAAVGPRPQSACTRSLSHSARTTRRRGAPSCSFIPTIDRARDQPSSPWPEQKIAGALRWERCSGRSLPAPLPLWESAGSGHRFGSVAEASRLESELSMVPEYEARRGPSCRRESPSRLTFLIAHK
jgi:hypothetical protein